MSANSLHGLRVVAYYRCSTDKQDRSIEDQKAWVHAHCQQHGLILLAEFEDEGVRGSEGLYAGKAGDELRPGLDEMAKFFAAQPAKRPLHGIVLWDCDRLSRGGQIRTYHFLAGLMEDGCRYLITQSKVYDLDDDIDVVIYSMQQEFARKGYSKSLSSNVTRSAIELARTGRTTGRPPYGYRKGADGKFEFNPATIDTARWIFTTYLTTDASLGDLARMLNERKVPGPGKSGKWKRDTLHKILHNRRYTGCSIWGETHQGKYHRVRKGEMAPAGNKEKRVAEKTDVEDQIIVPGAHPALITEDQHEEIRQKLARSKWQKSTPIPGGGEWVLTGLLYCGECNHRMQGRQEHHKRKGANGDPVSYVYRRYYCPRNAKEGDGACHRNGVIQEVILERLAVQLKEYFCNPERLRELEQQLAQRSAVAKKNQEREQEHLAARIAELDKMIQQGKRNLLLVAPDLVRELEPELRAWQTEREELIVKQRQMLSTHEDDAAVTTTIRAAMQELADLEETIKDAPPAQVRNVLGKLVKKVTVHFDHGGPKNKSAASRMDVEFLPEVANLLTYAAKSQQVSLVVTIKLDG